MMDAALFWFLLWCVAMVSLVILVAANRNLDERHKRLLEDYQWLRATHNATQNGEPAKFKDLTWITK